MTGTHRERLTQPESMSDETQEMESEEFRRTSSALGFVDTRRNVLRRSLLGVAGVGLTALVTGCGWGGDDNDASDVPDETGSGLEEGGEDPGEAQGIDEESGITEDDQVVGDPEDDAEETEEPDT